MSSQLLSPSLTSLIQKYNLDISIVEINDLELQTRIDPEFYQRKYLDEKHNIEKHKYFTLSQITKKVTDGTHYTPTYIESGIPFLSALNILDNQMETETYNFISQEEHNQLYKRANPEIGDILMRKVGVGARHSSVLFDIGFEFSIFVSVALIKLKEEYRNSNFYLSTFINSFYGQNQLLRFNKGASQPDLHLEDIRELKIPLPSPAFQSRIAELVQEAHTQRELSKSLYAEAEQILLKELGLIDWTPTEVGIAEKMSEEVRLFGRCDAEFFQPKYDELFERLAKFQTQKLGDIVDYQKGVEPGADAYSETGIPFIRVADVSIDGIDSIEKNISPELLEEYGDRYSPKKDEILFTKDGTIGISFVVNEDMRAVLSGAFLRLQKKIDIESEYLALVLNSVVSKMQIERFSGGAIIAHLKPSDAMEILIPILSLDIQSLISSRIIASHSAREKLKTLLEWAKRAVEIFIEEDESIAREFLRGL